MFWIFFYQYYAPTGAVLKMKESEIEDWKPSQDRLITN